MSQDYLFLKRSFLEFFKKLLPAIVDPTNVIMERWHQLREFLIDDTVTIEKIQDYVNKLSFAPFASSQLIEPNNGNTENTHRIHNRKMTQHPHSMSGNDIDKMLNNSKQNLNMKAIKNNNQNPKNGTAESSQALQPTKVQIPKQVAIGATLESPIKQRQQQQYIKIHGRSGSKHAEPGFRMHTEKVASTTRELDTPDDTRVIKKVMKLGTNHICKFLIYLNQQKKQRKSKFKV